MLLENQKIEVKWNKKNYEHYISLGYEFTKWGDTFFVRAEDLTNGSHSKIQVVCDYCGNIYDIQKYNYVKYHKNSKSSKDACANCRTKKSQESLYNTYGVESPVKVPEFKQKMFDTNLERYGTYCVLGNKEIQEKVRNTVFQNYGVYQIGEAPEIQEKIQTTCLNKYGYKSAFKHPNVREKINQTMLQKYGTTQIMDLQEYRDKAKQTCLKLYGGESSQCDKVIRQKSMETLRKNGTMPRSKAEIKMIELIKEIYGEESCIEQYPFDMCSFDCLLIIQDVKIDIEYDGLYWHDFNKDNRRDWYNIRRGFKVLRFKSDDKIPTKEQIIENVDYLVNSQHVRKIVNI